MNNNTKYVHLELLYEPGFTSYSALTLFVEILLLVFNVTPSKMKMKPLNTESLESGK